MSNTHQPQNVSRWTPLSTLACAISALLWLYFVPARAKFDASIVALAYAGIEYSWYATTVELPDGNVKFAPFSKHCRKPFTSLPQFWSNVLMQPIFYTLYRSLVSSTYWRIILYPFDAWLFEIICGYFLMFLYGGYNPAWFYVGEDVYCHGNIKMAHGKLWLLLGVVIEVTAPFMDKLWIAFLPMLANLNLFPSS
eukprot:GILJ01003592.1.p1 GENE.GILJ01003592.1~~GILJ01003592.1.p1  ORF type:complete len:195 (+),score=10.36 GILJ01003592.1:282-866(+)